MYWGQPDATYEDVAMPFGISRQRVKQVVKNTMNRLWEMSPEDVKTVYPLEQVLRGKSFRHQLVKKF